MLFDDKGCVFIATFGAHPKGVVGKLKVAAKMVLAINKNKKSKKRMGNVYEDDKADVVDLQSVKAALAISHEMQGAKIGVSAGAAFTGMCGVDQRHDYVVIGHEINMSARYMMHAQPNQVLVAPAVYAKTVHSLAFEELTLVVGKKTKKEVQAFTPLREIASTAKFQAQYRWVSCIGLEIVLL